MVLNGLSDYYKPTDCHLTNIKYLVVAGSSILVEGAGAASKAAALDLGDELAGKTVVLVVSGGPLDAAT